MPENWSWRGRASKESGYRAILPISFDREYCEFKLPWLLQEPDQTGEAGPRPNVVQFVNVNDRAVLATRDRGLQIRSVSRNPANAVPLVPRSLVGWV